MIDFTEFTDIDLVTIYGQILKEMRNRTLIRTKNVVGELGEFIVVDYYNKQSWLPNLQLEPTSTKDYDAISLAGDRYSIKCVTTNTTGVFHGIDEKAVKASTPPLFEYAVVVQLDETFQPKLILELTWDAFFAHKRWHKTMKAYCLTIGDSLIKDGRVIFKK